MSLLDDVSIVVTPNGYKAGELYAVVPVPTEGADVVTNGDFATDSGWNKNPNWSISGGVAISDGTSSSTMNQPMMVIGTRYEISIEVVSLTSGSGYQVRAGSGSAYNSTMNSIGVYTFTQVAKTNGYLYISATGYAVGSIDNISVKEYTAADMDVTRATAATRVDENGLVNYAEIVGGEEVTNGDFATDSDWSKASNWTISGGSASSDGVSATSNLSQTVIDFTGKTFLVEGVASNITQGFAYISLGGSDLQISVNSNGSFKHYVTISSGNSTLFISGRSNFTGSIDSISVKEVTRDNVPRIDYSGGGCPHILAEPMRTNLLPYSEDFSQWDATGAVVTINQAISPDGTLNADLVELDTDNDRLAEVISSSGGTYTFSYYVKAKEGESGIWASKVKGDSTINTSVFIDDSSWVRITQTFTLTGSGSLLTYSAYRRSGTSTLFNAYIWGAQLEEGSYPTSYIPTSGQAGGVTRAQDQFSRDGISSLINSAEGVLFVEMAALSDDLTYRSFMLNDGTNDNRMIIRYSNTSNTLQALCYISTGLTGFCQYVLTDETLFSKIAFKWKVNDFALWVDGVEVATDTSGAVPIGLNTLEFNTATDTQYLFAKVKQLQVYQSALSDTQLAALTS